MNNRIIALAIVAIGVLLGWYAFGDTKAFVRGLDLAGGVHLTYVADTSAAEPAEIEERMETLRAAIERRINVFGVSEPLVQVETGRGEGGTTEHRVIVELPGVTDVDEAVRQIGKTPALEFKLKRFATTTVATTTPSTATSTASTTAIAFVYEETGINGASVERATLQFDPTSGAPSVGLKFNPEGAALFGEVTTANVGQPMAIFLDGVEISSPVINEPITSGEAVISGGGPGFRSDEARQLVRDLNFGALPFNITLLQKQTIGPSLGIDTWDKSVKAFAVALVAVMAYMLVYYRRYGVVACISLALYGVLLIASFKFIPVTLTASGFAGLILSLGMAVDANVLVFERIKDEVRRGASRSEALEHGFARAWPSIRDGNLTSLISAFILYWMSTASLVQGFAVVYLIGILMSMLSAYWASRIFLRLFLPKTA